MNKLFIVPFLLFLSVAASAQYSSNQNKVWVFGYGTGLDFGSGTPTSITSGIYQMEGSASISDNYGNLLFYTNGKTVYDRTGAIMPSGDSIVTFQTNSTTQAAVIMPVLSTSNLYYIFSLENSLNTGTNKGRLAWSIVNMALNGGFGDVILSSRGTLMDSNLVEKLVAIQGGNCNLWLVGHRNSTAEFVAYEVTASGIAAPVVSVAGSVPGPLDFAGVLKADPAGDKLAAQTHSSSTGIGRLELYDFNKNTGIVSGCQVLDAVSNSYGAEFSPDNTKLYVDGSHIAQYDVSLGSTGAIIASKTDITTTAFFGDLRLAPDNKIYLPGGPVEHTYLDCISAPNMAGTACGYVSNAVSVFPATFMYGLPNVVVTNSSAIIGSAALCLGSSGTLSSLATGGTWISTNTSVATIGSASGIMFGLSAGTTTISYTVSGCTTFATVTVVSTPAAISGPATVCTGASVTLASSTLGGTWSSGNVTIATAGVTSGVVSGVSSGTVVISYSLGNTCNATAIVTVIPGPAAVTGPSVVCLGSAITLSDATPGGTWTSSNTFAATVGSATGIVNGMPGGPGGVVIRYTISSGCAVVKILSVSPVPSAGTIAGPDSVCLGHTIVLTDALGLSGGTWTTSNAAASVGTSGSVTGMSAGIDTVYYIASNGLCSASAAHAVVVYSCGSLAGMHFPGTDDMGLEIFPNPNSGSFSIHSSSANSENTAIVITNTLGQKIEELVITPGKTINASLHQPPGIYCLSATRSGTRHTFKIVIE